MAVTVTNRRPRALSDFKIAFSTVTFDSSYVTGGEPITPAMFGLSRIVAVYAFATATGYVPVWNRSTSAPTLMAFYGDNNNASDGPLIEVPNTTNLSTVIADVIVIGY